MPDYKEMYLTLVNEVSNTIDNLRAAMEKAEDIYMDTDETVDEPESSAVTNGKKISNLNLASK